MIKLGGECFLERTELELLLPWHRNTWYAKFKSGEIATERFGRLWVVPLEAVGKILKVNLTEEEVEKRLAEAREKAGQKRPGE